MQPNSHTSQQGGQKTPQAQQNQGHNQGQSGQQSQSGHNQDQQSGVHDGRASGRQQHAGADRDDEDERSAVHKVADDVGVLKEAAVRVGRHAKEAAVEVGQRVSEDLRASGERVRQSAEARVEQMREGALHARDYAADKAGLAESCIRRNPLAAVGGAIVLGYLLGMSQRRY